MSTTIDALDAAMSRHAEVTVLSEVNGQGSFRGRLTGRRVLLGPDAEQAYDVSPLNGDSTRLVRASSIILFPADDHDPVDHPAHYTSHPSGVECVQITEHFTFNIGNAIKYLWRAGLKGDAAEDLRKARWYVDREIARRGGETA